jgi:hypothetical protein
MSQLPSLLHIDIRDGCIVVQVWIWTDRDFGCGLRFAATGRNRPRCMTPSIPTIYPVQETWNRPLQSSTTAAVTSLMAGGMGRSAMRVVESIATIGAAHRQFQQQHHTNVKNHRQERRERQKLICVS